MPSKTSRIVAGPNGQVHIQTSRLLLRAAQAGHSTALHTVLKDPQVMKYWSTLPHTSLSQTEDWLTKMILSPQNGTTDFIISHNAIAIGKIGIWSPSSKPLGGEIGFLLAKDHQRQGFMTEAMKALLPYYVNDLGYEKITADVDPRNDASIALLLKFGFRIVGRREQTIEIGGEWVDSLDLELRVTPGVDAKVDEQPTSEE
jgi:ribosomal-protein-alanine N-acetyltransferase